MKKTAKNYRSRYVSRRNKEKKLLGEIKKIVKVIFKENEKLIQVSLTGVSLNSKKEKRVNGLSWSREDFIKPRKKRKSAKQDGGNGK